MNFVPVSSVSIKENSLIVKDGDTTEEFEFSDYSSMSPVSALEDSDSLFSVAITFRMKIFKAMEIVAVYGKRDEIDSFIVNLNKALKR